MIHTQNIVQRVLAQKDKVSLDEIIKLALRMHRSEHSVRACVNRLVRGGYLTKTKKNQTLYYQFSKDGEQKIQAVIEKHVRVEAQLRGASSVDSTWNGEWTVAVFGIPENHREKRDTFRKELIKLGFAMLFASIWISPYDKSKEVRNLIKALKLDDHSAVFLSRTIHFECCKDLKKMVYKVWNLEKFEKRFKKLVNRFEELAHYLRDKQKNKETLNARKIFPTIFELQIECLELFDEEPLLPHELLPKDWIGLRCHDVAHYVTDILNKMEFSDEYAYLVQVPEIRGLKLPKSKFYGK